MRPTRTPGGDEAARCFHTDPRKGPATEPVHWVDPEHAVPAQVSEVVREKHEMVVEEDVPVEIPQDEEAREPEAAPPERAGDP